MNATAAAHIPASHRPTRAPQPAEVAAAEVSLQPERAAKAHGGADTPFTHALEQGNGKKLGILKRLPTTEDVAAEQAAAGLGAAADDATPVDVSDALPVDDAVPADDAASTGGTILDGSTLGGLTTDRPSTSTLLDGLSNDLDLTDLIQGASEDA